MDGDGRSGRGWVEVAVRGRARACSAEQGTAGRARVVERAERRAVRRG
jgi:hypothetical protein